VELKANRGLCNCVIGVRAKPCECGALEALAFELYPMERARGMAIEAPAVHP
jgi:sulfur-oxidizing protein SoxA